MKYAIVIFGQMGIYAVLDDDKKILRFNTKDEANKTANDLQIDNFQVNEIVD